MTFVRDIAIEAAGPWKLYARWLVDSDKYNEWMNEVDYETEDASAEQDPAAGMQPRIGLVAV